MVAFSVPANAAFTNFDELVSGINDWCDRNDLTGVASQMIALAEDEIRMAVEPFFLEIETSLTSDETGKAALPTNVKRVSRIMYDGEPVPQRASTAVARMTEDTTQPWAFTLEQGGVRVWPAAAHTFQVLYQPKLTRLTSTTQTNNLLDEFPSLYFYGAMVFANGYLADDERAARFRSLFDSIKEQVKQYFMAQRNAGPLVARTAFVP